ncbi:glycosyl hydrolase family 28-related protein [Halogeometricum limi]|uniref:Pectate lyase superfamily protein n=1 Tax=Halogeometricum limi TaxID=555875 RepID=A0A1I6IKK3_9EURY|nr:glycosyl hydrolase family 28-related protein [Halogeometricum limi]SFR67317.1 Pectate lyase superfamily protein [Halogeometricum limi]
MVTDVTDFGAVGDGSTDDTKAIRNAADAAGPGGTVYFPSGTYLVGSNNPNPFRYPNDGSWNALTWEGAGADSVTIRMAGGWNRAYMVFRLESSRQTVSDVTFKGLTIDGNKQNQGTDAIGLCILTDAAGLFKMRDCVVKSAYNAGLKLTGDMDADIQYCTFANNGYPSNGGHAISPNQTSPTNTQIKWTLCKNQGGVDIDVGQDTTGVDWQTVVVERCVLRDSYRGSLKLSPENATTTVRNTQMLGNGNTQMPVKENPDTVPVGTLLLDDVLIDGSTWAGIDLPVPGQLEMHDVAIKNVNADDHRGGGMFLDGMDVTGGTISIHNVGSNNDGDAVTFSDSSGSIEKVIYGGTSSPSSWSDAGIVKQASAGTPLQPDVALEDAVGPRSGGGTDAGSGTTTDPAKYGGYNTPEPGTVDWHVPLNENFEKMEADVLELVERIQALEQNH